MRAPHPFDTVGSWFGITGSDLRYVIRRHRRRSPRYFSIATAELFPDLEGSAAGPDLSSAAPIARNTNGAPSPLHAAP